MLILLFVIFLALLAFGVELFYSMGIASLVYLLVVSAGLTGGQMPLPLTLIPQQFMEGVDSFPLLSVPMFLLAGELMSRGGVTQRLILFASVLVGHIRGGLAQVSIVANLIMSGMSGSAVADAAATGSLLIPGMIKKGYSPEYAAAVIASAATMGPIIPPSLLMVIIGSMVSVSVGQLFVGGIIPGLVMALAMMVLVYRFAKRNNLPVEPRATTPEFFRSLWDSALALIMPIIILGSILSGFATPTEASVVAVVYAFVVGKFIYREFRMSEVPEMLVSVSVISAAVMVTVASAQLFGWICTAEGLGTLISNWLTGVSTNPAVILLLINIVLLLLGTAMEPIPIMLITLPILFPVVTKLGVDPVHFGVVVTLNVMIGTLTPPVGTNIFVASAISGAPVGKVFYAARGFIWTLVLVLMLITYIPPLVTWLPRLIYGGN